VASTGGRASGGQAAVRAFWYVCGMSRWDWVAPIRETYFGQPLAGAFPIERILDEQDYWTLHDAALRRYFPLECFFDLRRLLDPEKLRSRSRLEMPERLCDFWVARDGQEVVAMFCGHQNDADTYRMWHSNVHGDYRRRGVYTDILRRILGYTSALGFSFVVSEHAPNNNAILIAKLKAGFRIVGMDVDAALGPSVLLKYFHNEAHLRAYEFRCGLATMDERLLACARGAMPLLIEQFGRGAGGKE
jgi:hypothetical protein